MPQLNSNLLSIPTPGQGCLPARSQQLSLALMDRLHPRRVRAEAFVQSVFRQAYGAQLQTFYPLLMSILFPGGEYAAVAGIRPAGSKALFSEHYFDEPVEHILGVDRHKIVEIGNLAPASAGQARWLICTLTAFLGGAGFTHVVFTAVPKLKNAFTRMGLPLTKLADASAARLPPEQHRYGSPNPETELMVAYAYDSIQRGNPVAFFGMVLVLEGTSIQARKLAKQYPDSAGPMVWLAINPDGIDPNYFYGDFMLEQDNYSEAVRYLEKASAAPPRPDRPLADLGRKREISAKLAQARSKL